MTDKINFLNKLKDNVILFDGGLGTELYNRGIYINKCFESLNLTDSNIVSQIHQDYIDSGADVIETNSYGANYFKLQKFHLHDKLYDINFKAAQIAKEVAGSERYVAGSIGPLGIQIEPLGPISLDETKNYFSEQIKALVEGGVDLLIFETFIYPNELIQAVKAAREYTNIPIIAQMTIDDFGNALTGASPQLMIYELEDTGADIIGINCSVGPQTMLQWLESVRKMTDFPISIMPNAGKPKNVEGRNLYLTSPEYMGQYAKHFIQAGANIIGGCCGTGPDHIKRMRNMIHAVKPEITTSIIKHTDKLQADNIEIIEQHNKSRLARRMAEGEFVKFVELLAPHGVSAQKEIEKAKELYYYGIDVINIPDGPRASARMSALAMAVQIQREVGIETVLHYVCRDRNIIGIQSDLLGAYALGLKNILAITGDPPKIGNYPDATAVFDVDSIGLVNILNRLNHGLDIAANPIGKPSGFFVGVGANPGAINLDEEIKRLHWKVEAGAEYFITQPVFDIKIFENFLNKTHDIKIPIIAGLWPLTSIRNAEFMNNEIPGCDVPNHILERLRKYTDSKEDSFKEGVDIARETLHQITPMIQGIQISAPLGRIQGVMDVLKK